MVAQKPASPREPSCVHAPYGHHAASACSTCKDGPRLREWREGWAAWLAENSDSMEARHVRATDRCVAAMKADPGHLGGGFTYPCWRCCRAED